MLSITCPECGLTSYNPTDIAEGFCGACHDWTGPRKPDLVDLEHALLIAEDEIAKTADAINRKWPRAIP
jgi:hypothetical protein